MKSIVDNEKLTALANAIRTKTNTTDSLTIDQMTSAIENISVGGGEDRFKKFIDIRGCNYLFAYYEGENVDDLINYNDTENISEMNNMFLSCTKLTKNPRINTDNLKSAMSMFSRCTNIVEINNLNFNNLTNTNSMYDGCSSLEKITPIINMEKVTNSFYMFSGCLKLKEVTLINIKVASFSFNGCSDLSLESLINTCKECIYVSTSRKLTIGTANMEKIANVYVKFIDPSITTIALNEKGEVEVCDSSAINSMTLAQYMSLKNWSLA